MEPSIQYARLYSAVRQVFLDRLHEHADFISLAAVHHSTPEFALAYAGGPIRIGQDIVPAEDVTRLLNLARHLTAGEDSESLQEALARHFQLSPILSPPSSTSLL